MTEKPETLQERARVQATRYHKSGVVPKLLRTLAERIDELEHENAHLKCDHHSCPDPERCDCLCRGCVDRIDELERENKSLRAEVRWHEDNTENTR